MCNNLFLFILPHLLFFVLLQNYRRMLPRCSKPKRKRDNNKQTCDKRIKQRGIRDGFVRWAQHLKPTTANMYAGLLFKLDPDTFQSMRWVDINSLPGTMARKKAVYAYLQSIQKNKKTDDESWTNRDDVAFMNNAKKVADLHTEAGHDVGSSLKLDDRTIQLPYTSDQPLDDGTLAKTFCTYSDDSGVSFDTLIDNAKNEWLRNTVKIDAIQVLSNPEPVNWERVETPDLLDYTSDN